MAAENVPSKGTPDASFSRKLIESFVAEDSVATNLAGTAAEPAAAPAASGAGGPILLQYANYLGMDVVADSDLLWIAQQALTAELPPGWTEHADPMSGDNYCTTPGSICPSSATFSSSLTAFRDRPQRGYW